MVIMMKVSIDIKYISEEQFFIDLSYLYDALKKSLKIQRSDLLKKQGKKIELQYYIKYIKNIGMEEIKSHIRLRNS